MADLAAFLKYAEARTASTQVAVVPGNAIAAAIGQGLAARGFAVRYGVGCSAYKVDVTVVDPDDPANLVFGIETDGPVYQLAPTARDRDRLRAAVLGTMGWRLARVWSPDWLADPVRELTRLDTGLVNAIAAARAAKKTPPSAAPVVVAPPPLATPETTVANLGGAGDGANEQSQGIVAINSAVDVLDQSTQQNAALVEQSSAAAHNLRQQAARLTELVGVQGRLTVAWI